MKSHGDNTWEMVQLGGSVIRDKADASGVQQHSDDVVSCKGLRQNTLPHRHLGWVAGSDVRAGLLRLVRGWRLAVNQALPY